MGNLPKNATMDPVLFFGMNYNDNFDYQLPFWVCNQINMKYILCQRRRVYAGKQRLRWHRHKNEFFGLKTVDNQKSVNLGMISAILPTDKVSKK